MVCRWTGGRRCGVLIRGASGAGKSTLALRCLEAGFRLVADDRVVVWASGGALYGKAPAPLAGLIEVRGVGIMAVQPTERLSPIDLVVDLAPSNERLPDPATVEIAQVSVPHLTLPLADTDLPLRLAAALAALQRGL